MTTEALTPLRVLVHRRQMLPMVFSCGWVLRSWFQRGGPMIVWTTEPCSMDDVRIQSAACSQKVREVVVPVPLPVGVDAIAAAG